VTKRNSFTSCRGVGAALLFAIPAVLASACGPTTPGPGQAGAPGAVGLALQVSPGVSVTTGSYTVTGPNGFMSMGTLTVGQSSDVPVVLESVPAGTGYTLAATAVASDGFTTCTGSVPFDVTSGMMSKVVVHLVCRAQPGVGGVTLNGETNVCASIDGVDAVPTEVLVGGVVGLSAAGHDLDSGPARLTFTWSADTGSLSAIAGPSSVFRCTTAGPATITASVSDGDPGCGADSLTIDVTCTAP